MSLQKYPTMDVYFQSFYNMHVQYRVPHPELVRKDPPRGLRCRSSAVFGHLTAYLPDKAM